MGIQPIFTPPHVKDLMANGDNLYKPHDHTPENAIHLNHDSRIEETEKYDWVKQSPLNL